MGYIIYFEVLVFSSNNYYFSELYILCETNDIEYVFNTLILRFLVWN